MCFFDAFFLEHADPSQILATERKIQKFLVILTNNDFFFVAATKMEVINSAIDINGNSVVRWTVSRFFSNVDSYTHYLDSDKFSLGGLTSQFFLRVEFNYDIDHYANYLSFYLCVHDMKFEKSILVMFKC